MSHEDMPVIREVWAVVTAERGGLYVLHDTEHDAREELVAMDDKYRPAWLVRCEVSRTDPVALIHFGGDVMEVPS